MLGGVALFLGFSVAILILFSTDDLESVNTPLLISSVLMFLLGFYDDYKRINPVQKLVIQIIAAIIVIFWGNLVIRFFPWPIANILLTLFWLIGITNGINLLDNMDGIAGGIAMIAAGVLAIHFWMSSDLAPLWLALAMVGSAMSFLIFNFPPARIFMGDSGSMFLGFTLASLAIVRTQQASSVFSVVAVPVLVFLAPIFDTSLVTITRLLRGISPAEGGTDHSTHRLVAFGLSPKQVAWVFYAVAGMGGLISMAVERIDYELSLILVPLILIALSLLTAYLGRVKIVQGSPHETNRFARLIVDLVFGRNLIELLLDVALISISYYLSFWFRFGFDMTQESMALYLASWPIAILVGLVNFKLFGIYRGIWGHLNVIYILRISGAAVFAAVASGIIATFLGDGLIYPLGIWPLYGFFVFLSLVGSRASFYFLDNLIKMREFPLDGVPREKILVYGAGIKGEFAIRWLSQLQNYEIIGLLDEDQRLWGRTMYERPIFGGSEHVSYLIDDHKVNGIIVSAPELLNLIPYESIVETCAMKGVWVRVMQISLEDLPPHA
jgi:UDP-GlcNAc:undecaprenyl-phosphate GlcNAc-1-phosphate transferase